jgi:hypothetical protein
LQLSQQTSLVDRFDQPWPFLPVHLNRRSNDFGTEFIGHANLRYLRFLLLILMDR